MGIQANSSDVSKQDQSELLKDGLHYTGDKGPAFGIRHIQIGIMAIGTGISFTYRTTLSIAIGAMTDTTSSNKNVPTYDWQNTNVIISSIFWGAVCLQLVSGYLGKRYGPKWFVLGSNFINSLGFVLIPLAAKYCGSTGVIVCRIIQGLCQGMLLPMGSVISGIWVPIEERSRMGFVGASGITLSVVFSSIATGYIADSDIGWPWVFYIFGGLGLIWCVFYLFLGAQNPATHPRITHEEKTYIQVSLNQKEAKDIPTPWKQIFTSVHFWAILVAQGGVGWILILISAEMPIFLSKVMQYGLKSTGVISAIPPLVGAFSGLPLSFTSDYIPRRKILSLLNSRRIFHTIGVIGCSICLLLMTFIPVKYSVWAVVLLCIANFFIIGAIVGGSDVNTLDISPMFAGITFGFYSTVAHAMALFAPLVIQWIVEEETSAVEWRTIFLITVGIAIGTAIFFDIFATATRQNWDSETENDAKIMTAKRKGSVLSISGMVVP